MGFHIVSSDKTNFHSSNLSFRARRSAYPEWDMRFFCVSGRDSKSCRHSPVDCDCGQFKNWPLQLFLQSKMQPNLSFRARRSAYPEWDMRFFCVSGRDSKSCRHSPVDCDCGQFKNWPLQLFLQSKMQPNLSFRAKEAHIPNGICAFFCISGRDSKSCKRISPSAPVLDFPPLIRYLIIKFPMNLRDIDVF